MINKSILKIQEIKQIEKDLQKDNINYPYCIGIDGATATGKTILANLLKEYLKKKLNIKSEIFQLDYLLLDRNFREKDVVNIKMNNIKFSYEAENHMRFNKINRLLNEINKIKKFQQEKKKIKIFNLYSRKNDGKCNEEKVLDLSKKVLIFEGHYTSRNKISSVLDKNIILFSSRKNILMRKINRTKNYRDPKDVTDYFDHIDSPSIINNFLRFYKPEFQLIDTNNFAAPKTLTYRNALKTLGYNKQKVEKNENSLKSMFGYVYSNEKFFLTIKSILDGVNTNNIELLFKNINLNYKKYNLFHNQINQDVVFIVEQNNKKYFIIQNKINKNQFLVSFENGLFLIDNKDVLNLGISRFSNLKTITNIEFKDKKYVNSKASIFEYFFKFKKKTRQLIFLKLLNSNNDKFFLFNFFQNSGWQIKFLDDFYFLAPNFVDNNFLKKKRSEINLNYLCDLNYTKNLFYEKKKILYSSKNFWINSDFCEIKNKINKKNFNELKRLILSNNYEIRKNVYNALLNYKFDSKNKIKNLTKNYISLYPTSFSRLYAINKILDVQTGILANNIYDLSDKSVDITAYLEASSSKKLPFILQSSLNAIGHEEKNNKEYKIGYLKVKDGPKKYVNSISSSILYLNKKNKLKNLFYGIGLDHIDLNGDKPKGRSKRFLNQALKTKSITHLTLDSSALFKVKNTKLETLSKIYQKIFDHSNLLIKGLDFLNCDLEYCSGELNYIGKTNSAHYPIKDEISMFDKIYNSSIDKIFGKEKYLNFILKDKIKLYVANLGTTHHGEDKENNLKINLSKEWNEANYNKRFISPVLHGTTNSNDSLFKIASKYCLKINIAGTYLNILFSNLDSETKKKIRFKKFDKDTKYLAYELRKIGFNKKKKSLRKLKEKFIKYANMNNYKNLKVKNLDELRVSTYYMKNVSNSFLAELKKILSK